MYSEKDVQRIDTYGRSEIFRAMFDGRVPSCDEVLALTFEQMLIAGCEDINFQSTNGEFLFSSNNPWFNPSELNAMLAGMPQIDMNAGRNSIRVETVYRYLFGKIQFFASDEEIVLEGYISDTMLDNSNSNSFQFSLILGDFGQYNWNEQRT